MSFYKTDQW